MCPVEIYKSTSNANIAGKHLCKQDWKLFFCWIKMVELWLLADLLPTACCWEVMIKWVASDYSAGRIITVKLDRSLQAMTTQPHILPALTEHWLNTTIVSSLLLTSPANNCQQKPSIQGCPPQFCSHCLENSYCQWAAVDGSLMLLCIDELLKESSGDLSKIIHI